MEHNDCQHCLEISVQNWIKSGNHHLLGADSKHNFPQHLISFCNFSSGQDGSFSLCFQTLWGKSSNTLEHHHPTLRKTSLALALYIISGPCWSGSTPSCGTPQGRRLSVSALPTRWTSAALGVMWSSWFSKRPGSCPIFREVYSCLQGRI